jgi:integrase
MGCPHIREGCLWVVATWFGWIEWWTGRRREMAIKNSGGDEGAVVVKVKAGGPRFYGKWRDPEDRTKQVEVPIGAAWVVPVGDPLAKANGLTIGRVVEAGVARARWCDRRGSAPGGAFTIRAANRQLPELYANWLVQAAAAAREVEALAAEAARERVTFDHAAYAWLDEKEAIAGWKPTTVRNMRRYLRRPGTVPDLRGAQPKARILTRFGHRMVHEITEREVRDFLRELDRDPDLCARSVNGYRAILRQVLGYAAQEGWCDTNVARDVPKRREADVPELLVFTKDQVEAVARKAKDPLYGDTIRVAAGTGLRRGELAELRWRDINFKARSIRIERSYAAGFTDDLTKAITTPKGRRGRTVPLADPIADILIQRRATSPYTNPNDLIFSTPTGDHLDPWRISRRYTARNMAETKDPNIPHLSFHALRHTFCSHLAVADIDVVRIQKWPGHSDLTTTQRYMHHADRPDDADQLTRALS